MLVCVAVFSLSTGIFHQYYSVQLAPAVAALAGAGGVALWKLGSRQRWLRFVLPTAIVVTAAWAVMLLDRTPDYHPWLRPAIVAGAAIAAAGLWLGRWLRRRAVVVVAARCRRGHAARRARGLRADHHPDRRRAARSCRPVPRRARPGLGAPGAIAGGGAGGAVARVARASAVRRRPTLRSSPTSRRTAATRSTSWPRSARRARPRSSSPRASRSSRSAGSTAATPRRPWPSSRPSSPRAKSATCSSAATAPMVAARWRARRRHRRQPVDRQLGHDQRKGGAAGQFHEHRRRHALRRVRRRLNPPQADGPGRPIPRRAARTHRSPPFSLSHVHPKGDRARNIRSRIDMDDFEESTAATPNVPARRPDDDDFWGDDAEPAATGRPSRRRSWRTWLVAGVGAAAIGAAAVAGIGAASSDSSLASAAAGSNAAVRATGLRTARAASAAPRARRTARIRAGRSGRDRDDQHDRRVDDHGRGHERADDQGHDDVVDRRDQVDGHEATRPSTSPTSRWATPSWWLGTTSNGTVTATRIRDGVPTGAGPMGGGPGRCGCRRRPAGTASREAVSQGSGQSAQSGSNASNAT